ncbi:MAG: hypothetical protein Q9184_005858 [Pyrenodesmia sp. 2 TL-2023]
MAMRIRSPYRAPTTHREEFAQNPHGVCFRHPAIPSAQGNLLIILDGNDNAQGCLHHETARIACAIIAGNRWDGYLATSPTANAIDVPPHGLLTGEDYYFIVPHPVEASTSHPGENTDPQPNAPPPDPYHYPVVPNFGEWVFPSGKLPGTWNTMAKRRSPGVASTSDTTRSRDQCCRMTEAVEETDISHIVPLAEEPWFTRNDMIRYGNKHASSRPGINDDANTMLLRADLHRAFDKRRFTFLPKKQGALVTHVLESESLRHIYHNVQLNTTYIAPEYFFARFAWTIFPLLKPFLRRGQRRLLLIQGQHQWASPAECSDFADPPSKSRSASPTKKNRSPSKRTWVEMEGEPDYASQDPDGEPIPNGATDDARYPHAKRPRRGRSPAPRPCTAASLPSSHRPPTPPRSGKCVPSPESVSSMFGDAAPDLEAEIHEAGDGESSHCPGVQHSPDAQQTTGIPIAQEDSAATMTPRRLRAMVSLHLVQERKRSDPEGQWEKHEAWLDKILRSGGALDSSEIDKWMYVNGNESIPELDE